MRIGRVRTRADFAALAASRCRARCGVVRVRAVLGEPADRAAVAYAVARSVGPAVVRNRVRRRLRAGVREVDPGAGTYLIAVTPAAAVTPYATLRDDVATALAHVGARHAGARA